MLWNPDFHLSIMQHCKTSISDFNMLRASPKFTSLWAGARRQNYPRKSDVSARSLTAAISAPNTIPPSIGDPRLQFLVHTRLIVERSDGEDYSPSRSGIIYLALDVGIDGLKSQIWSLLRSNKYAHDSMKCEDYSAKLAVRVKWMMGDVRVPDAVLETDAEVRSAIEFMAERGFKDIFSVTCYLTPDSKTAEDDAEYVTNDERAHTHCAVHGGWDWYETREESQAIEKGPTGTSDEEEQLEGGSEW